MTPTDEYRQMAKEQYHSDGEIEIDDDADVSISIGGAYVQAWVWVDDSNKAE